MRTRKGESISYGLTTAGIMVQVQRAKPIEAEWDQMVEALSGEREKLLGIVVVAYGDGGPSAAQRQKVAKIAATYPKTFRGVVFLTDSMLVRATATAIQWLIPGEINSLTFGLKDLDRGLEALRLDRQQAHEVRGLVAELGPTPE